MLDKKATQELARQVRRSKLREVFNEEVDRLLAKRPSGVAPEEYCAMFAGLVVNELRSRLCAASKFRLPDTAADKVNTANKELDFDTVLKGLFLGIQYDLLTENLQMVKALGEAIAQRDTGNSWHNPRVTLYSTRLAETLHLEQSQIQALIKGSFLHDIGKIGIPDKILLKTGGLNDDERRIMNSHTELGARMIGGVTWLEDAMDVVRHHHEKFDGTGYPDRLKGEEIPLNARIFAVVDVFDALISRRPYKPAFSYDETMDKIDRRIGRHFDPKIARVFVSIARPLYDELGTDTYPVLDNKVNRCIQTHFGIDPEVLRNRAEIDH